MNAWQKNKLLIIGIIVIIASSFLLVEANSKQDECESLKGQIIKIFDEDKQAICENVKLTQIFAYAGIAIGIALVVINFVKKD
jgi:hypothetical protein